MNNADVPVQSAVKIQEGWGGLRLIIGNIKWTDLQSYCFFPYNLFCHRNYATSATCVVIAIVI